MKTKLTAGTWLAYGIILLPVVYLAIIYPSLPQTIPTRFALNGADVYGDKSNSWLVVLVMGVLELIVYLGVNKLYFIDPLAQKSRPQKAMKKAALFALVLITLFQLLIINGMQQSMPAPRKLILFALSIFFALMGNLMINFKPNYVMGIRIPWTLSSEDNWRKTHRLAGQLYFVCGILLAPITWLLPYETATICFFSTAVFITIVPMIFSYNYFRKHRHAS